MPSKPPTQLTLTEYKAIVDSIPTYCPTATFTVAGQTFTAPQAVTFVKSVLDAVDAVATAKTGWKDAKINEATIIAKDGAAVKAIRDSIALMFSNNTTTLAAFAIAPKKPRAPMSAAARAAANAKSKATRLARGTASKKKKATISGNVVGVDIVPVTGTTTPSSATSGGASTASSTPAITPAVTPAQTTSASTPATPAATASGSAPSGAMGAKA